ncbi:MAG: hypothetical protein LBK18_00265 [Prevotellaceae bacterium]|jgi:hypothetical protein|nr:hypothetical protein [Prevotellaceae bacterium]
MQNVKTTLFLSAAALLCACGEGNPPKIDRQALVERNSPVVTAVDKLSSLTLGNGNFAFTVDATGLQTFPEHYAEGVPLGTQSQWGWHSFPNVNGYKPCEALRDYDFRGRKEPYSVQLREPARRRDAVSYLRANPHRLHLGNIGLEITKNGQRAGVEDIKDVRQKLHLWSGCAGSSFCVDGDSVTVSAAVHPTRDAVAAHISSPLIGKGRLGVNLRFAYPTGAHTDDGCDRTAPQKHKTEVAAISDSSLLLKRTLDSAVYYVSVAWSGRATTSWPEPHRCVIAPESGDFSFVCEFAEAPPAQPIDDAAAVIAEASRYWQSFWRGGGAVDFSECTDARAPELERRVTLSQYLLAVQSAGVYPPQETGLTYNSWFGKFHLEMHWWHAAHFPLWRRDSLLLRSVGWYEKALPVAKSIAERQGFEGVRWMKMTDPSGEEAPSSVGSFLIWQQPHIIYLLELLYRNSPSPEFIERYAELVEQTAAFMASFATYDEAGKRYLLKGIIPAQETLRASETVNPPFELSYWHYALLVAQQWRERRGAPRNPQWDDIADNLSPLAAKDGLYLASEDAVSTYTDVRFTSDHPAVLGAVGVLPMSRLVRKDYMENTLSWIWDGWNWDKTWGWDYPMVAMSAARLGNPAKAVGALLMDKRTNTYLVGGNNYQDDRLRVYLPGNGGLLAAIAMMCAGWDGCTVKNPGFPKDGTWNVRWENLAPAP